MNGSFQRVVFLYVVLAAGMAAGAATAADSTDRGKEVADRICAACHIVSSAKGGTDAVPTFDEIVNEKRRSTSYLRGFLLMPHLTMPDFQLTVQQIDDVVAYFGSLATAQPR